MCGDVTLEFCGVMLTVLGILNVMHIYRAHVQAVITRVWHTASFQGYNYWSLIHGGGGGWCGIFKSGGWEQSRWSFTACMRHDAHVYS